MTIKTELSPKKGTPMSFDPVSAAERIAAEHRQRATYANLTGDLAPPTIADAYAAQEALRDIWRPSRGEVAGLKIATTTRVMQQLMGIDHPCGGMIYAHDVHRSPAAIDKSRFVHMVVECELAVRLGADLPDRGKPYDRQSVKPAIAAVMPAFELIEDRHSVYKECKAVSLIADNAWNGGVVLGAETPFDGTMELDGLAGRLSIDGKAAHQGKSDDPLGALAWVANLAVERKRPMRAGMISITGSVIVTLPIEAGQTFRFELDGLGATEMTAK